MTMTLSQIFKSKTINFNLIVGSITLIAQGFGHTIPPDYVTAIATIGNIILRLITKEPISDK